jgi:hypothetical protein
MVRAETFPNRSGTAMEKSWKVCMGEQDGRTQNGELARM